MKSPRFLRVFAFLSMFVFSGAAWAEGYTCDTTYVSCKAGYYPTQTATSTECYNTAVNMNACRPCSVYEAGPGAGKPYSCAGGTIGTTPEATICPQEVTVSVSYVINTGASGTAPSSTTCTPGVDCTLNDGATNTFYREGYVMVGWNTNSAATSGSFSVNVSTNTTVYAIWQPCSGATYKDSTKNASAACDACLAADSGWTLDTSGTAWTSATSCNQTITVGGNCTIGQLQKNQTNETTWGASTVSIALGANEGYYVDGQTCTSCVAGTYQSVTGSAATSCSACTDATWSDDGAGSCSSCPTGYDANTTANKTAESQCQTSCAANYSVTSPNQQCQGCYAGYASAGGLVNYGDTSTNTCTYCSAGYYCPTTGGGEQSCPAPYYSSDTGASSSTDCYKSCPTATNAVSMTSTRDYYNIDDCHVSTCNADYYISGDSCQPCGANSSTSYANGSATCTCDNGYVNSSGGTTVSGGEACQLDQVTVTYNISNASGTEPSAELCTPNVACPLHDGSVNTFYRAGYVLVGWSEDSGATTGDFSITTSSSTTVYAVWQLCPGAEYKDSSRNANAACDACLAADSGWTLNTNGHGWSDYTYCNQTQDVGGDCVFGQLQKNQTSPTTWGMETVSTPLWATPGSYVDGHTCSPCAAGTSSAGGTVTTCSSCASGAYCPCSGCGEQTCPAPYTLSDSSATADTDCYRTCATATNAATMTTARDYYNVTDCQIATCSAGYKLQGGACVACTSPEVCDGTSVHSCPDGGINAGNAGNDSQCYKTCPAAGTTANGTVSQNQTQQNWNGTEYPTCTYHVDCATDYRPVDQDSANPTCEYGVECPANSVCDPDPRACSTVGDGSYTLSASGTTDPNMCYKNCAFSAPVTGMSGHDYFGTTDTCAVSSCATGYFKNGTGTSATCEPLDCTSTQYIDGNTCATCPSGGNAPAGADEITDCTKSITCDDGAGGEGTQVCEYNGVDAYDQSCTTCTLNTCPDGYRLDGGSCVICDEGWICKQSEVPFQCPGGGTTEEKGSTDIAQCYLIQNYPEFDHGTADSKCFYTSGTDAGSNVIYNTRCSYIPKTCDAGYYYVDGGACNAVESGFYGPVMDGDSKPLNRAECPTGHAGSDNGPGGTIARDSITDCYQSCSISVANSTSVTPTESKVYFDTIEYPACEFSVTCEVGYVATNSPSALPSCPAKQYTVTLNKNGGTGTTPASVDCTFNSGVCAMPATTALTRAGYTTANEWCSDANGAAPCYAAGANVTTNISASGNAHTLYAKWAPAIYTVNLDDQGGTTAGAPTPVYLKYATGWYSDSLASTLISALTTKPELGGYTFTGYYTQSSAAGTQIVDSNGNFISSGAALTMTTSSPTTIYASWAAGTTTCSAGQYYTGTGDVCATCTADHYCPGGDSATDGGENGQFECPDGGESAAGATSNAQCYKTGLTYTATHGAGTQRCFYKTGEGYNDRCDTQVITSCHVGYYHVSGADCNEVGTSYYSPAGDMTREQCPNSGTTATTTSGSIQDCFKSGLSYTATNGSGTQRCFYSSGTGAAAVYARSCDTQVINKCSAGYWLDIVTTTLDCSPVGQNWFSPSDVITRTACPDSGRTISTTSTSGAQCYLSVEYAATHGAGLQRCFYSMATGTGGNYDANCDNILITSCHAGYYRLNTSAVDCIVVGLNNYSPVDDLERYSCPSGGETTTTTSSANTQCFKTGVTCTITNGTGTQTCFYTGTAYANCTASVCTVTDCDDGYELTGNACTQGDSGEVCKDGVCSSCTTLTGGTHPMSDAGTSSVANCYKNCAMGTNATAMTGRDYYSATDTCAITSCAAGYTLSGGVCVICPAGSYCDGGSNPPVACPAGYTDGNTGLTSINQCAKNCPSYSVTGGTAIPVSAKAMYPSDCEYGCISTSGNAGELIGNTCVETSCSSTHEMIDGACQPCNREHAMSYKTDGNCQVATCAFGYHPAGDTCTDNVRECTAPHATEAYITWDATQKAFGNCIIKVCDDGYHLDANACVLNEQVCAVENGTGTKEWDAARKKWGNCVATSCNPGFTSDRTETNEHTKQCGECKNKYSVLGQVAVSSYIRGCEIASCMYQGEMYNLDGNECMPICDVNGYEDETGTMRWDNTTKKCVRQCNDGYSMW